jgi:hypothetical protein
MWLSISISILSLSLAGCVSAPRVTPQERCAMTGLSLGSTSSVSAGGTVGATTGIFGASGYQCVRPTSERERCEIEANAAAGRTKDDYGVVGKNVIIGVGYLLYIVPGVLMYFIFDGHKDSVEEDANTRRDQQLRRCAAIPAPTGPPGQADRAAIR